MPVLGSRAASSGAASSVRGAVSCSSCSCWRGNSCCCLAESRCLFCLGFRLSEFPSAALTVLWFCSLFSSVWTGFWLFGGFLACFAQLSVSFPL